MNFISKLFVDYFWFWMSLWGVLHMFGLKSFEGGMMKIAVGIAAWNIVCNKIKFHAIDIVVCFFVVFSLFSYGWFSYPTEYFNIALVNQVFPISMLYVARCRCCRDNNFINNMYLPLLFCFVCALYLYFFSPSWYIAYKTNDWTWDYTGDVYYEHMRLSGFWPWSYFIGYASLFFIMLLGTERFLLHKQRRFWGISMFIALIVLLLAQQRASIAYLFVFVALLFCFKKNYSLKIKRKYFFWALCVVFFFMVFLFVALSHMEKDFLDYVLNRSVNSNSNLIVDRISLYWHFFSNISLGGDGLGSHSHTIRFFAWKEMISDCDYVRILRELGIVGMLLVVIIFSLPLIKNMKRIRLYFFEYNVIFFLHLSMIGATPLEHLPLHPYIYWYCLGRIVDCKTQNCAVNSYETTK